MTPKVTTRKREIPAAKELPAPPSLDSVIKRWAAAEQRMINMRALPPLMPKWIVSGLTTVLTIIDEQLYLRTTNFPQWKMTPVVSLSEANLKVATSTHIHSVLIPGLTSITSGIIKQSI